jgi:MOSC domain-containing protein YiiM
VLKVIERVNGACAGVYAEVLAAGTVHVGDQAIADPA